MASGDLRELVVGRHLLNNYGRAEYKRIEQKSVGRRKNEEKNRNKNNWKNTGFDQTLETQEPQRHNGTMGIAEKNKMKSGNGIPLSTIHGPAGLSTSSIRKLRVGGRF